MRRAFLLVWVGLAGCAGPPAPPPPMAVSATPSPVADGLEVAFQSQNVSDLEKALKGRPASVRDGLFEKAMLEGKWEVFRYLAEHGVDLDGHNSEGTAWLLRSFDFTVMDGKLLKVDVRMRRYLIEHCKKVNVRRSYGGSTALHSAVSQGDREMVQLLMAHGADPHIRDKEFGDCLGLARKSHPELLPLLQKKK